MVIVFFVTFGYSWLGVLYEILLNAIIALITGKILSSKLFIKEWCLFRTTKTEQNFYNFIKVKKWKDKVLELGALGGFRKNKLENSNNEEYLNKFVLEINKGIADHFFSIFICLLLFVIPPFINMYYVTIPIVVVAIILNIMPLIVLKYVKPKIVKLIAYNKQKKERGE